MKKYNKLVRDKIPEIIMNKGEDCHFHKADKDEYWNKLKEKLKEEVDEFLEEESKEELADILEVLESICKAKGYSTEEIDEIKMEKAKDKGDFSGKIILDEA